MIHFKHSIVALVAYFVLLAPACAEKAATKTTDFSRQLTVLPAQIELSGPESRHRLLAAWQQADELVGQAHQAKFTSSDESVVRVEEGIVHPISDGQAVITAQVGEQLAEVEVRVSRMQQPHQWSFQEHVQPVLAKAGCNSGACHGALAGKGGFRLSLRGYDPEQDHFEITRQAGGRRIELGDPGRSLFLLKPTGSVPHKGGLRFDTNSTEYRILSQWVASGAPGPQKSDPVVEKIEVLPPGALLQKGDRHDLIVQAQYSDGRVADVTRWAVFSSANEAVSTVSEDGTVEVVGHGEGAVTAWFASKIAITRITSPYANQLDEEAFADFEEVNRFDELVAAQLRRLNLPPSAKADDATFIRRAFLDTIGVLPTAEETRAFLNDSSTEKRERLIDELLQRPEFVDYWTYKWSDVLLINGRRLRPDAVKAYYQWVRSHVEQNTPWDELAREVVTAKGDSFSEGATNFYALHQDPGNHDGKCMQGVHGTIHWLCKMSQPSAGEMDQRPILRDGQSVRPSEGERLGRRPA